MTTRDPKPSTPSPARPAEPARTAPRGPTPVVRTGLRAGPYSYL